MFWSWSNTLNAKNLPTSMRLIRSAGCCASCNIRAVVGVNGTNATFELDFKIESIVAKFWLA